MEESWKDKVKVDLANADLEDLFRYLFPGDIFQYSKKQLDYLAFWVHTGTQSELNDSGRQLRSPIYSKAFVSKRNGKKRMLLIPCSTLKTIQNRILKKILEPVSADLLEPQCVWFRKGYSIVDNAFPHVNKTFILKLDISDFFPSIDRPRAYGYFRKVLGLNHICSNYLAWFCTFRNQLPQWAPTSPMLANLIASKMDRRIRGYITKMGKAYSYTRYADDMTISGDRLPFNSLLNRSIAIIEDEWFSVNYEKLRSIGSQKSAEITGITVNQAVSAKWKLLRKLRTALHLARKRGSLVAAMDYWQSSNESSKNGKTPFQFLNSMGWYLAYLTMIYDKSSQLQWIISQPYPRALGQISEDYEFLCKKYGVNNGRNK